VLRAAGPGGAGATRGTTGSAIKIAGFFEHGARMFAIASSQGGWAHHAWTTAELTCTARTPDGTGSGWAGSRSHRVGDVDAAALAKIAVDKAVASAKPARLDPGRYTVVLEPAAVASLMTFLTGSFNARRADEGRSFFSRPGGGTKVGDKLFPETITLRSDPTDAQLAVMPFDRDAVPLAPATWIEKGTVRGLTYGRYWAKKQGKPATGQPDGWVLDGGTATRDELIKGVKRGVLITRFWYLRWIDQQSILVTGLTRDGVFLIENGAITRPVNNFRFNESPVQMLGKCDGLTAAVVSPEGNLRVPALRTHEFNLASISEAV
jgi:predicted Zn-dependent protease